MTAAKNKSRTDGLTPMLRHYLEVKAEHEDAILLYRMGDFYETFFEDAEIAAPIFEIQLTARQKGTPSEAPMCGVPHHALDAYASKLLRAGRKVAICDQVEDPKTAKGLVRREVTRVLTPGTLSELDLLDSSSANHLLTVAGGAEGAVEGSLLDLSTGSFLGRRWASAEELLDEIGTWSVAEVLVADERLGDGLLDALRQRVTCVTRLERDLVPRPTDAARDLMDQFGVESLAGLGLDEESPLVVAAAASLAYARRNAFSSLPHITDFQVERDESVLVLDETTLRNLEILRSSNEGRRVGSLLWVLDRTRTAAGGRLLKRWLGRPLRSREGIEARLDAVEELQRQSLRSRVSEGLAGVPDLERLTARAVLGNLQPAEAGALRGGLGSVPGLLGTIEDCSSELLRGIGESDRCTDLHAFLAEALSEEPPSSVRNGGIIADGFDADLDELRTLTRDAKGVLLELEAGERARTGIGSLKVRFNRVFGYYIEVSKANQHLVPEHYVRKQTLANAERYITEELKALEERILGAEERQLELEERLYGAIRERIAGEHRRLNALGAALARLDVLASFAEVSDSRGYRRPRLEAAGSPLQIDAGRHPVVEKSVARDFVPNDTLLDEDARILLITGPNMGGKSTYLRQVALIAIIAHCGCFVPAESASVPLLDRVFTRVGASDNLSRGESTFMVEMSETANILRHASRDSLVILDEVGRGTATFDGLSLAWAIVEHLHEAVGAKTVFATHYHELTELAAVLPALQNRAIAVREWQDRIVFLHRVVPGTADKSYGLQVGKLAGLPARVIERAGEVLGNLEAQALDPRGRPKLGEGSGAPQREERDQLTLFARPEDVVADVLREVDLDRVTPLAAINLLQSLQARLRGEE